MQYKKENQNALLGNFISKQGNKIYFISTGKSLDCKTCFFVTVTLLYLVVTEVRRGGIKGVVGDTSVSGFNVVFFLLEIQTHVSVLV